MNIPSRRASPQTYTTSLGPVDTIPIWHDSKIVNKHERSIPTGKVTIKNGYAPVAAMCGHEVTGQDRGERVLAGPETGLIGVDLRISGSRIRRPTHFSDQQLTRSNREVG
jgi:hypothetical protein